MSGRESEQKVLGALVEAVEEGQLGLLEALRIARKGGPSLTSWKGSHANLMEQRPPRRPRRAAYPVLPPEVIARALEAVRRRVAKRPGVLSVHWGVRFTKGRATGEPGVVVAVRTKRPKELLRRTAVLPKSLAIVRRGRRYVIGIDVQASGGAGVLHAGVMPGDFATVDVRGGDAGTLSAILDGANPRAIFSGHVATAQNLPVTATTARGEDVPLGSVTKVILTSLVDAASAGPVSPAAIGALARHAMALRPIDDSLVNEKVFLLLPRDFEPTPSYVADVYVSAEFWYGGMTREMEDLIALFPQVTSGGDSGAPVMDFNNQIIGFVLGAKAGKTYLLPAERVIDAFV
jgi:hypothetical protein